MQTSQPVVDTASHDQPIWNAERFVSCLALTLAVTFTIAKAFFRCWRSDDGALAASIPDDSFYALVPAWHVWTYGRLTFDGIHGAYGFQPLWEAVLVVLAGLSSSKHAFLRLALFLSYLLYVAAALVAGDLVRVVTRGTRRWSAAGTITVCLLLLNAQLSWIASAGKETALYLFLLISALRITLAPHASTWSDSRTTWTGVLWSLVPLARLTPASLIITGLGFWWIGRHRFSFRSSVAWLLAPAFWVAAAWMMFGHVWPTSGLLKSQPVRDAISSGQFVDDLPAMLALAPSYFLEVARFSIGYSSRFAQSIPTLSAQTVSALALAACLGLFVRPRNLDRRLVVAILAALAGILPVVAVLHYRADEQYYFGAWYHAELPLLVAVSVGVGLAAWPKGFATVVAALLCIPLVQGVRSAPGYALTPVQRDPGNLQYVITETASYLNSLPGIQHMTIASWNAGLLGFLARATVINLDGLANEDIRRFTRAGGSIGDYLRQQGVRFLVDARRTNAPSRLDHVELSVVHVTPWSGRPGFEPGWFVMQVTQP